MKSKIIFLICIIIGCSIGISVMCVILFDSKSDSDSKKVSSEIVDRSTVITDSSKDSDNPSQNTNDIKGGSATVDEKRENTVDNSDVDQSTVVNDIRQEISYNLYTNGRFGFSAEYPGVYKEDEFQSDNGDGISLHTDESTLLIYGEYQVAFSDGYEMQNNLGKWKPDAVFDYVFENECAYTFQEGTNETYAYSYFIKGKSAGIISFEISYPISNRELYSEYIDNIRQSIKENIDFY